MKPNFALNLTHEAIGLLHRTARGWLTIGEAAIDRADLAEAIGFLRASALGLSPQGITTKLVIPNSQILYTEVDAPATDPAKREAQVRAALDGRTPYAVDELVFDIHGTGLRVQVAVVARETLAEAEEFAIQHRMNPVSCVAIPPEGAFKGEAFFGPTAAAARFLPPGETVERDAEAVSVVTRDENGARAEGAPRNRRQRQAQAAEARAAASATTAPPSPADDAPAPATARPDGVLTLDLPAAPALPETPPATLADAAPSAERPGAASAGMEPTSMTPAPVVPETPPPAVAAPADSAVAAALSDIRVPEALPPAPASVPEPLAPKEAEGAAQSSGPIGKPLAPEVAAQAAEARQDQSVTAPAIPAPPAFTSRRRDENAPSATGSAPLREPLPSRDVSAPSRQLPLSRDGSAPIDAPAARGAVPPPVPTPPPSAPVAAPAAPVPAAASLADAKAARREIPPLTVVASATGLAGIKAAAGGGTAARALPQGIEGAAARPVPRPTLAAVPSAASKPVARPRVGAMVPNPRGPAVVGEDLVGQPGRGAAPAMPPARPRDVRAAPRGKPRFLGLILTGLLLLLLVIVAAWSSLVLSRDESPAAAGTEVADGTATGSPADSDLPVAPAPVELTAEADPDLPPDTASVAVEDDPEYLADLAAMGEAVEDTTPSPDLAVEADSGAEAIAPDADVPEAVGADTDAQPAAEIAPDANRADAAPVAEALPPDPVPAPETATAGVAAAVPLPADATRQDEIFLAATDAPPPAFDAAALPPPSAAADVPPAAALPPPPAGAVYRFDDQGRILATATGVVAPGGFWLIAARPPVLPPARPAAPVAAVGAAPATASPATDLPAVPAEAEAAPPVPIDPAIAEARPRSRPASLVPPPAPDAQADDGAALSAPADPRFASLRPRARASSAVVLAAAARGDSGAASLVRTAAAGAPPTMALSPRPAARPADLSRAVEAAVAAAVRPEEPVAAEPPPRDAPVASAEPEADAEPEVASAAPRIPTRASVAKQATFANAINLSKVNLIGIYGTPSDRYAMIRTSAGRFTRVKVGDRVDGGTVAAITASELRYQKGGRLVTLAMPRG